MHQVNYIQLNGPTCATELDQKPTIAIVCAQYREKPPIKFNRKNTMLTKRTENMMEKISTLFDEILINS